MKQYLIVLDYNADGTYGLRWFSTELEMQKFCSEQNWTGEIEHVLVVSQSLSPRVEAGLYEGRLESLKNTALAKLTDEDKKVLGLK